MGGEKETDRERTIRDEQRKEVGWIKERKWENRLTKR